MRVERRHLDRLDSLRCARCGAVMRPASFNGWLSRAGMFAAWIRRGRSMCNLCRETVKALGGL